MTSPRPLAVDIDAVRTLAQGLRFRPDRRSYAIEANMRDAVADALDAVANAAAEPIAAARSADPQAIADVLERARVQMEATGLDEMMRSVRSATAAAAELERQRDAAVLKARRLRRELRALNKAHAMLWKVLQLRMDTGGRAIVKHSGQLRIVVYVPDEADAADAATIRRIVDAVDNKGKYAALG